MSITSDFDRVYRSGDSASAAARRGNSQIEWNLPAIDRMSYDAFLAFLVDKHGDGYLQTPDGEPLAIVDPQGVTRGYAMVRPAYQRPKPVMRIVPDYIHPSRNTSHIDLVTDALADGPKIVREISAIVGISTGQINDVFSRYHDRFEKTDRRKGKSHYWRLKGERP